MSWLDSLKKWVGVGRSKAAKSLAADRSESYRASHWQRYSAANLIVHELPIFTLETARLMLDSDPLIRFALNVRNAALAAAEVTITARDPRVKAWVERQWKTLWNKHRGSLVAAHRWGFSAIQPLWKIGADGVTDICDVKEFSPQDVRPLSHCSRPVGFRLRRPDVKLLAPRGCWITFDGEAGAFYGNGCLRRMYQPWFYKWMQGGQQKLLQQRMLKDSYIGDIVWYPPDLLAKLPDGTQLPWKDVMREVAECRVSGSALSLPMLKDREGNKLVEYTPPQDITGGTQIFEWGGKLDEDILRGADVAIEVVKASETGSGFSGRSIPLMVTLSACTQELIDIVKAIETQVLRPAAWLNFGGDPEFAIEPKPLMESFAKDAGGSPMGGSAIGGQPGQQPGQPAQQVPPKPPGDGLRMGWVDEDGNVTQFDEKAIDSIRWNGLEIAVEFRTGEKRKPHHTPLSNDYGHFIGYRGKDGDSIDAFIGPSLESEIVFVVDQKRENGRFDEHKVMLGFNNLAAARSAYLANYPPGWKVGEITPMTAGQFVAWLEDGNTNKAISGQVSRFDETEDGNRWITIGGKSEGDKKHKGGFPVQIDGEGRIVKSGGPQGLVGKHVSRAGDHFATERHNKAREQEAKDWESGRKGWGTIVARQAKKWGMDPETYEEFADGVWAERVKSHAEREAAKAYARKRLKLNARDVARLEEKGFDYGSRHDKIRGLDTIGREMASMFPSLGWGGGYDSGDERSDLDEQVWELVREGKIDIPGRTSREFHQEIDDHLQSLRDTRKNQREYVPAPEDVPDQFDETEDGNRWITIGGKPEGDKKHKGGFPVQIDGEGRIVKSGGPGALVGKKVGEVKQHFDAMRGKGEAPPAAEQPAPEPPEPAEEQPPAPPAAEEPKKPAEPENDEEARKKKLAQMIAEMDEARRQRMAQRNAPAAAEEPKEPVKPVKVKKAARLAKMPSNAEKKSYNYLRDMIKAKFVPRAPKEGESLLLLDRPQIAGGGFAEYEVGDMFFGSHRGFGGASDGPGRHYVVTAAKPGFTRSAPGEWKKWQQIVCVREATEEDHGAVAEQKAQQDAETKRVLDQAMGFPGSPRAAPEKPAEEPAPKTPESTPPPAPAPPRPSPAAPSPAAPSPAAPSKSGGRIDLRVPYANKDRAKELGARWDPAKKVWYAPTQEVADRIRRARLER